MIRNHKIGFYKVSPTKRDKHFFIKVFIEKGKELNHESFKVFN